MFSKHQLIFLFGLIICLCRIWQVFGGNIARYRSQAFLTAKRPFWESLTTLEEGGDKNATEEQMMSAGKLMRDVCLPKFPKVTKDIADSIREGNLPNEKDPKCYVNCILEMMQTMKKGKFLYEGSLKQVDILMPDHFKDEYKAGLTKCKDAAVGIKNNCDASYAIFICLRGEISKFVFP